MRARQQSVEQDGEPRPTLLRAGLCALASAAAAGLAWSQGAARLDVALWAVLVAIGVATLLELVAQARRLTHRTRQARSPVVLPDPVEQAAAAALPSEQLRAVEQARADLLAARQRGASMDELVELARAKHEAELELARASAVAGGVVRQDLRDELALRDRPTWVRS